MINSVEDLVGLKMRIPGLGGEVMQRAGVTQVTLPASEIFTSLQTGAIDAAEWVGPYNDVSLGLHKAARYYYYPGWHEPGPMLELIVNKDAWQTLPDDLQAIVELACQAINLVGILAERVENASNGRLKIKVYAGGELVPPLEVFDAVSRGTAQMGHDAAYYHRGKVPAAQYFTSIPFGQNANETNAWLYYGGGWDRGR